MEGKEEVSTSMEEGDDEEPKILKDFETTPSIPAEVKRIYLDYKKDKEFTEDVRKVQETLKSVGAQHQPKLPAQRELQTKRVEDKATTKLRQERQAEAQDVLKTERQLSQMGKSRIQSILRQQGTKRKETLGAPSTRPTRQTKKDAKPTTPEPMKKEN